MSGPLDTAFGPLTIGQRCKVVGVSCGFLAVFGFLATVVLVLNAPAAFLTVVSDAYLDGRMRTLVAACIVAPFIAVGLPVLIVICLAAVVQGALGKRTALTRWILRQVTWPPAGRT